MNTSASKKYMDEIIKIRSTYEVTLLSHSSVNIILRNIYIQNGCVGILDPLKFYERFGIFGTRQIVNEGEQSVTVKLENRASEIVQFETGCVFAELRIISLA